MPLAFGMWCWTCSGPMRSGTVRSNGLRQTLFRCWQTCAGSRSVHTADVGTRSACQNKKSGQPEGLPLTWCATAENSAPAVFLCCIEGYSVQSNATQTARCLNSKNVK